MQILDGYVKWWGGWGSRPALHLLVDRMPPREAYVYEKRKLGCGRDSLYFAEAEGMCRFYCWSGRPDEGFGGAKFDLALKDGTREVLVGPWSSSEATMNGAGFPACVEAMVMEEKDRAAWVEQRRHSHVNPTFTGQGWRTRRKYCPAMTWSGHFLLEVVDAAKGRVLVPDYFHPGGKVWCPDPVYVSMVGASCELVRVASGGGSPEMSGEQNAAIMHGSAPQPGPEFFYEVAARMPDGSIWRKPK